MFADRGYDATTTASIAEAAGITEPVLYRHFDSKKEMFRVILTEGTAKMAAYWQDVIGGIDDPAEQFRRMAECFQEHLAATNVQHQIVLSAMATNRDPEIRQLLSQHYATFADLITQLIRRGQEAGAFRTDIDSVAAAWVLVDLGIGHSLVSLGLDSHSQNAKTAMELAINGLRA